MLTTDDNKPTRKITVTHIFASGVDEEGHIAIEKIYPDRVERIIFDDVFELEMVLEQLTDRLPRAKCPECGTMMPVWYVKEYTCERCDQTFSENYLEYYDTIMASGIDEKEDNKDDQT